MSDFSNAPATPSQSPSFSTFGAENAQSAGVPAATAAESGTSPSAGNFVDSWNTGESWGATSPTYSSSSFPPPPPPPSPSQTQTQTQTQTQPGFSDEAEFGAPATPTPTPTTPSAYDYDNNNNNGAVEMISPQTPYSDMINNSPQPAAAPFETTGVSTGDPTGMGLMASPEQQQQQQQQPGLRDQFFGAIPSTAAAVGNRLMETTKTSIYESWKAIFVSLLVFLLFSYAFRIDWVHILDGVADYVTVFAQNLVRSFRETPKQVREKAKKRSAATTTAAAPAATTTTAQSTSTTSRSRNVQDLLRPVTTRTSNSNDNSTTDGVLDLTPPSSSSSSSSSGFRVSSQQQPSPQGWLNARFLDLSGTSEGFHRYTTTAAAPAASAEPFNGDAQAQPKGHQFCLVGQLPSSQPGVAPQRGCVLVKSADECMSGQLFPTKLECMRPPAPPDGKEKSAVADSQPTPPQQQQQQQQ